MPPASPSSSLRRNSLHEGDNSYASLRRSSTADGGQAPAHSQYYSPPSYNVSSSLRRSATNERHPPSEVSTAGSLSRNGSFQDGSHFNLDHNASRSQTPVNYNRYSSLLDDNHDWGFRTLRRRNSKVGLPPKHDQNDDIKF